VKISIVPLFGCLPLRNSSRNRNKIGTAFEWLDQAWNYRDPSVHNLLYDPFIGRYKDDPRFTAYWRKIGLSVPGVEERTVTK
jgi:hypothetical protein